jgi:uncharacterized protein YjbJ (UPF0337 family)
MTNKDIVKGKLKQAEGKAEDAFGQATDSPEHEAKGKLKQAEGHVQEAYGKTKQAVKDALNDSK